MNPRFFQGSMTEEKQMGEQPVLYSGMHFNQFITDGRPRLISGASNMAAGNAPSPTKLGIRETGKPTSNTSLSLLTISLCLLPTFPPALGQLFLLHSK